MIPKYYLLLLLLFSTVLSAQEPGQFLGSQAVGHPAWFKSSFLDIAEDIDEARNENKRLIMYFYQDGCPYCAKLVQENFSDVGLLTQLRANFDLIAINMFGDVLVTDRDGEALPEKAFARKYDVQFTPTLVFFDKDGSQKIRLSGYRSIEKMRTVMNYVVDESTAGKSFGDFVSERKVAIADQPMPSASYFLPPPYSLVRTNIVSQRSLAVFFETVSCEDCISYHLNGLADKEVIARLEKMDVVQLDVNSNAPVLTPDGRSLTAQQWARELDVTYTPSIVFFDEAGQEVFRTNGMLKAFHTRASLEYVLTKGYLKEPSFQRFLEHYADQVRESGVDVNIWGN